MNQTPNTYASLIKKIIFLFLQTHLQSTHTHTTKRHMHWIALSLILLCFSSPRHIFHSLYSFLGVLCWCVSCALFNVVISSTSSSFLFIRLWLYFCSLLCIPFHSIHALLLLAPFVLFCFVLADFFVTCCQLFNLSKHMMSNKIFPFRSSFSQTFTIYPVATRKGLEQVTTWNAHGIWCRCWCYFVLLCDSIWTIKMVYLLFYLIYPDLVSRFLFLLHWNEKLHQSSVLIFFSISYISIWNLKGKCHSMCLFVEFRCISFT